KLVRARRRDDGLTQVAALAAFRGHGAQLFGEGRDLLAGPLQAFALSRGRMLPDADAGAPGDRRPDRPRCEPAAAVRADVEQHRLDAGRAEGALIAADPRVDGIRRQVAIAAFAIGSELEHAVMMAARRAGGNDSGAKVSANASARS